MTTEISARLAEMAPQRVAAGGASTHRIGRLPTPPATGRAGPTRSPTNRHIARQRPWRYIEGYARRYQWTVDHPIPVT
jgi:hypothetical protein